MTKEEALDTRLDALETALEALIGTLHEAGINLNRVYEELDAKALPLSDGERKALYLRFKPARYRLP